jgi:LPXTG-motif cell wall-anchored protein
MCGCSANFDGDDNYDGFVNRPKELVYENFSSNREKELVVGNSDADAFDFVGDLDGKTEFDSFIGKKAKARRQERRANKQVLKGGTATPDAGGDTGTDTEKNTYGTSSWFSNNWIYLVIGVAVIGGGYYFYKKRK